MVIKEVIVALGLLTLVRRSTALSCPPRTCGPTPTCSYGFTEDACGQCDVCAKGPGEKCGGPWDISGTCGDGLECQFDQFIPVDDFNKEGICVEKATEERFWLGGSDIKSEGRWVWLNGEPLGEQFPWTGHEPNDSDGNEDCLEWGYKGNYNDMLCTAKLRYVCEKTNYAPAPTTPESRYAIRSDCEEGVVVAGQCLVFSMDKLSWQDAKESCYDQNAALVSLADPRAFHEYAARIYAVTVCKDAQPFCESFQECTHEWQKMMCPNLCGTCGTDDNWSKTKSACIKENNIRQTLTKVLSIDDCKEMCAAEKGTVCRSIDYHPTKYYCNLSELKSDSEHYTEPCYNNEGWLYAERRLDDDVACHPRGGNIKQRDCCPWWSDDRSQCYKYDDCLCREGFVGDRCEHDCEVKRCPLVVDPVCVARYSGEPDWSYPSKCHYYLDKCNNEPVHFKYDGECQDDALCGPIDCPMDVAVEYYDDPNRPGCKLCRSATNHPCPSG